MVYKYEEKKPFVYTPYSKLSFDVLQNMHTFVGLVVFLMLMCTRHMSYFDLETSRQLDRIQKMILRRSA